MLNNAHSPVTQILILSNRDKDVTTVLRYLSKSDADFVHHCAESRLECIEALHQHTWDVLLADYSVPDFTALDMLHYLKAMNSIVPVIVFAQTSDEAQIVEAMRCGALDFITQRNWSRLLPAVQRALQMDRQSDDRKVIENSFQAFEDQFRQLLDLENTSLLAWDAQAEQITFHYNVESIFGESIPDSDNGVTYLLSKLHQDDRAKLERNQYSDLISHDTFVFEGRVVWPDGSTQWLRANGKVFYGEDQSVQYVVALAQNVTHEQSVQNQLANKETSSLDFQAEKARVLDRMHRRFMMMAAHEFRTPLTIISTANELLYEHYDQLSAEVHREYLQDIREQIRLMREMLTEIESIARDEYIAKEFSPHPTDIVALSREIIQEIFEFEPNVGRISFESQLHSAVQTIDRRLVGHILSQLLQNAVKFSSPRGKILLIANDDTDGILILSVSDQGIGIPTEDLPYIYDAFVRGSNIGAISGRGIGLKIVLDCVYLHQGSIDVRSTVNKGTQFTVKLPTKRIDHSE